MRRKAQAAPKPASPIEWMSPAEAAAHIGTTVQYLCKLRWHGGALPYYQPTGPGGKILYRRDEVDEWILSSRRTSTSEPHRPKEKDAALAGIVQ